MIPVPMTPPCSLMLTMTGTFSSGDFDFSDSDDDEDLPPGHCRIPPPAECRCLLREDASEPGVTGVGAIIFRGSITNFFCFFQS